MEKFDLYKDMQLRTGGEIYAGIVGPVRTGKSAFARKFVELLVLPELTDAQRNMTRDAMPSSASGRTVTTVEPKFIPREAISLAVGDGTDMKVRIVDCVGFLVPGAEGVEENGHPRLVQTPWQEQPVPFLGGRQNGDAEGDTGACDDCTCRDYGWKLWRAAKGGVSRCRA